jgi:hypothetical protein
MCHRVPLDRLALEARTIPLAELLMTKMQIVELNVKDVVDILAILHAHEVSDHDDDAVNAELIAEWLAGDWGLWRTMKGNVEVVREHLTRCDLTVEERRRIDDRLIRLWERVEQRPKSLRWRSRAKLGDRARWYEEPEIAVRPAEA